MTLCDQFPVFMGSDEDGMVRTSSDMICCESPDESKSKVILPLKVDWSFLGK